VVQRLSLLQPTPSIRLEIDARAAHSAGYSSRCSTTIHTARSRISCGYLVPVGTTPYFQTLESPEKPGRFKRHSTGWGPPWLRRRYCRPPQLVRQRGSRGLPGVSEREVVRQSRSTCPAQPRPAAGSRRRLLPGRMPLRAMATRSRRTFISGWLFAAGCLGVTALPQPYGDCEQRGYAESGQQQLPLLITIAATCARQRGDLGSGRLHRRERRSCHCGLGTW
jgi:hypothetical protein